MFLQERKVPEAEITGVRNWLVFQGVRKPSLQFLLRVLRDSPQLSFTSLLNTADFSSGLLNSFTTPEVFQPAFRRCFYTGRLGVSADLQTCGVLPPESRQHQQVVFLRRGWGRRVAVSQQPAFFLGVFV